ncbi:MAG: patatin family protein [Ruminococcus sp.]|jgi:predicted patatin/cPLA2 family phospholipase|nr:patatin family protein [Ruminococcus sp.]
MSNKKIGLVLEGGTFRGIFSAGVMDAFLMRGIEFPYITGVSAGISNAVSYVSKQPGRNLELLERFRNDKRYLGFENFIKNGAYFGLDFVYNEIPNIHVPFDYNTFRQYKGEIKVGVTNAETGKEEFLNALKDTEKWEYLRASCAIPGYFPAIKIDGKSFYDGGLASPVTYAKALKDGCEKLVIILTRPKGFVRKLSKSTAAMSQIIKFRYPKLEMLLLARHKIYNAQMARISELEKSGKAIVIRPLYTLESFEKDVTRIRENYRHGFDVAESYLPQIEELF